MVLKKHFLPCWFSYLLLLTAYSYWSWLPTAPNTFLFSQSNFVAWQYVVWAKLTPNHLLLTISYGVLILLLFANFLWLLRIWQKSSSKFNLKKVLLVVLGTALPLFFAFNVLSFDVFNYAFNAKMVMHYHANPHRQVALDFRHDPWLDFMHNVHTSAPYGYVWTGITMFFYFLSGGKLLLLWLGLRGGNLLVMLALLTTIVALAKKTTRPINTQLLLALFANPLVLLELIGNIHNDWWMMWPALGAIYYLYPSKSARLSGKQIILGIAFLMLSISIKYATVVLLPLLLAINLPVNCLPYWQKIHCWLRQNFFTLAALLLLLPLLTSRSQLFHPWYLTWSLSFYPLIESKLLRRLLLLFSFASLCRYLPFLLIMGYDSHTLAYQQLITSLPGLYLLYEVGKKFCQHYVAKK